ncbi:MAG: 2-C-methyl-D-erythritol 4-phosphate cytidylyltransferase [Actinomycetota bacterium]|nr:2-C-methyl-D-erythritol 4-phosphate cytidylyltransferase [Actinomycetota bacterium]
MSGSVVVVLPAPALAHSVEHPYVVDGGATRAQSVRAGLAAVPADAGIVVVADAAHPLASAALHRAVAEAVRAGADGAVPGLPVNEVLTRVEHGAASGTVSRAGLVLTQTPQAFRADLLHPARRGARGRR